MHNTMENVELQGETNKATQDSSAATCFSKTTDNALNHKVSDNCQITKRQQKPVDIQASAREECVLMYEKFILLAKLLLPHLGRKMN